MLTHITTARDMRGDEDTLIIPETTIGFMFKLTDIYVEGCSPQLSRREGSDQRLLVDDFASRDVHQDSARLHGGKSLPTDQLGRLRCPLTTDHHGVALPEESIEMLGAFQAAESGWKYGIGHYPAPGASHPHAGTGAQPRHLLADASCTYDAYRLTLQQPGAVRAMVETMPLPIARCLVQPPG